jgi:outer membrane receptor protein involved in Fe transport
MVCRSAHWQRGGRGAAFALSGSVIAMVAASAAIAQASTSEPAAAAPVATAPANVTAPSAQPADAPGAGEIVVTANKREQKLSDVGLSVAVVGGDALKNQKISSLADIANTVPGLSFTQTANNSPVYTLRGVGFYETSIGAYPTVPVYIDEFPLSFPVTTSHSSFDLERIEVLKGPQGTLFGQNATGGAINYIAAKPTRDFHAGIEGSYGRFSTADTEAYVSGAITDTLLARVSGRFDHIDGWQVSNTRPGDRNGKSNTYAGRLLLDFRPTDRLRFNLDVNGWRETGETQSPQYVATLPQQPNLTEAESSQSFSPRTPRAADWTPGLPYKNNSMFQAALRSDFDVTDGVTLTSLTSYVRYTQNQRSEGDGLPAESLDIVLNLGKIHSFSQELRLSNGGNHPFRWVLGSNYEHSTVDQQIQVDCNDSSTAPLFFPACGPNYTSNQKMTNYAFFGNAEYDITRMLTIKGGVRYTESRRHADLCTRDIQDTPDVGDFFYDILLGGAFGAYRRGDCYVINDQGTTINGVAPGAPGPYAASLNEHNVSWRVGVDFKPQPGLLIYGNVSKGYKAGSFPAVSASTFTQFLPVKQESVQAYEGGIKASLFDRAVDVTAAGYYYDYKNKQLRSKTLALPFGILDILQNIPKSDVKGAELQVDARPFRGLSTSVAFSYTDAKIKKFTGINAAGVAAVFDGTRVPFTPKYQVSFNADYTTPVSEHLKAFVGGTVSYRSGTVAVVGGDIAPPTTASAVGNPELIGGYTLVDLRAGVASRDDRWRLSIYGKNVFNKYYWTNVVAAFDTIGRYAGMPGTYGVSLAFKY